MPRVPMIDQRDQASPEQLETFDHIAASRGRMIRPFAAMIHRPELARAAADVGAVIRYHGLLNDHDRELVIVSTAIERNCGFEWDSHAPLAREAGVAETTLDEVKGSASISDSSDAVLVEFVRQVCRDGRLADEAFQAAEARLGQEGVVELAAMIGYYSMLAVFMGACEVC